MKDKATKAKIEHETAPLSPVSSEEEVTKTTTEQALVYARDLARMVRRECEKQAAIDRLRHTFLSTVNRDIFLAVK